MGGSTKTTTQQSSPWAPAIADLKEALAGARNAYDTTYNGSSVADQTDWTKAGMSMGANNAYGGMTSQLAGQAGDVQRALAPRHLARLARGLARARRRLLLRALLTDPRQRVGLLNPTGHAGLPDVHSSSIFMQVLFLKSRSQP